MPTQSESSATQTVAVGLATPQPTAKETVAVGLATPQPTAKDTPTLVLPISGLLGIHGPLVAKIKEGKFTYMAVMVHFALHRATPLATYMAIVARLAREVPGECWLRYDCMFRQAVAVNPALPWDRREP